MIEGYVDSDGVPTILINSAGRIWKATIDTGFNGDLELPVALRSFGNPVFFAPIVSYLAGGHIIEEDAYFVDYEFDGAAIRPLATFVQGDEILIGTNMLKAYTLVIEFPNRIVRLERTASETSDT